MLNYLKNREEIMSTTQPIRSYEDIQRLKAYYLKKGVYRDFLLVSVCLNTALRIQDVLSLKWEDVMNTETHKIKEHIRITEKKTGKQTTIIINKSVKSAIKLFLKNCEIKSEYIFASSRGVPITRFEAYNIIKKGGIAIGLDYKISCHSLRKTFGYHAWKKGTPPTLLMQIYNHSNYNITKRYLGIVQDDKDNVYKAVEL
jgi:integrase